jgi:Uma2 family endonuclease
MSAEEFLRWEHPGIAEWVNGEVSFMAVTNEHQRVVDFLNRLLGIFVQIYELGIVRSAPYAMRAVPGGAIREPDLMFISKANRERLRREMLDGPADLVIEVVSEESVARDYDDKFAEYQDAGVQEYWIIDPRPNRRRASFFQRDAQGRLHPALVDADDIYRSSTLTGFWLKLAWLWQSDPEPDALTALAEIVGPEKLIAALRAQQ